MKKDKLQNTTKLKEASKFIRMYVAPLVTVVLFLFILIFLLIPKVSEIFNGLDTISTLSSESKELESRLATLTDLANKSNLLVAELQIINETATTGNTEVVKFRDTITDLCNQNNIRIVSQSLSEADIIDSETLNINKGLVLQEIPFNFEINGNYQNILNFIEDLSALEEFIIVREMSLSGADTQLGTVESTMKLTIDKYQFIVRDIDIMQATYLSVPETAEINQKVLEYIDTRVN